MPKFAKRYVLGEVVNQAGEPACKTDEKYRVYGPLSMFNYRWPDEFYTDPAPRYRLVLERVEPRTEAVRPTKRMEADTD